MKMKVVIIFAALALCIALVLVFNATLSGDSFLGLKSRSQSDLAGIAAGCQELFEKYGGEAGKRKLSGNDSSLPSAVRKLQPTSAVINQEGVMLQIRTKYDSYSIVWYSPDPDKVKWQLEAVAEGSRQLLYSTNLPPRALNKI